jgi:transposase
MMNEPLLPFEDFTNLTPSEMYEYLLKVTDKLQDASFEIARLRHQLFGRKSEKSKAFTHPTLPGLERVFDEAPVAGEEVGPQDTREEEQSDQTSQDKPVRQNKTTGRKPLPDYLPRERIVHELEKSAQQCSCGHTLHKIGEEVSEQLDYIPAQVKVIQHVRYKYGCKACEEGIKTAPVPSQPIPKSMATANLLAHVFVSKFDDHVPLYRQVEIWQRCGVDLNRATLSNWVMKAGALCQPLVDLFRSHIIASSYAQADETTVTLLKQSQSRHKSYMWVYKTGYGPPCLVYEFQRSREGKHATAFLEGFEGYLQGDAYSGYNEVTSQPGVRRLGCMAHARRKFVDIINMAPKKQGYAHQAVEKIKHLYKIEADIGEKKLSLDEVKLYREQHAKPLLENLKKWLEEIKPKAPPKGPLGRAIAYALNHWTELTRYLEDGRLAIDNNACERAIKPFTVGRKNWLFMGNDKGAMSAAALYSLIETAKANGINPYEYLRYVLDTLPKLETDQLPQLLPWNCPSSLQQTFKLAA